MSTYIYFVLGVVTAIYVVRATDALAKKFWRFAIVPAWEIMKPRPGGKLWAALKIIGLN